MKDSKSLLLGLLTAGLVITWIYHLYDKNQYSHRTKEVYIKDSIAVAEAVKDSLQKIYVETLDRLNAEKLDTDSVNVHLKGTLDERLQEINNLKFEVAEILKRKDFNQADLKEAGQKIKVLQGKIDELKSENNTLADERQRLNSILDQLNNQVTGLQQNIQKVSSENKELTQKVNEASTFVASEIKLSIINLRNGAKEQETSLARRADKFVVSFVVQNNIANYNKAELIVAIIDPEGKTLLEDVWDSGSFETRSGSRKSFTRKVNIDYTKGEKKKLIFSIDHANFEKGVYKLNIYHNGIMIGEASQALS